MQTVLKDVDARMNAALEALTRDFATVRTGRASAALLDAIRVDYYGTPTPIQQMASVSTPDARTLAIQPWEAGQIGVIEKAIQKSDLGLTPVNDGKLIRLTMPTPTEERRKQLVKTVAKMAEDARVAIRNVRREANDKLKAAAKDKKAVLSEDEERRAHDRQGRRAAEEKGAGDPVILRRAAPAPALEALGEQDLLALVRSQPAPAHVAIIMDGNGRWATRKGLPRVAGHREGVKAARAIVRAADAVGLRYLTLYAFSTENWSRPQDEVTTLMRLLEESIYRELPELMERNVRLRVIGRHHGVPLPVRRGIDHVVNETRANSGLTLLMAFNYGGRDELLDAFRALARRVRAGELAPDDISETDVSGALYTDGVPDPDLLIRTSGEMRVSNFLLWQIAYTELWITPTYWPDFGAVDLYRAVAEFQRRTRRFGGV